eukprot:TRINITY_DN4677_c1_g4_i2.p1 TRINITY_DN4677_c1_g4~~TRINITY_DN4677_c1_g4_i2.p1  ORF type:complete len:1108 (-),score=409.30 TRINITY_DN4677_c1_g4_i2:126-3197(-)
MKYVDKQQREWTNQSERSPVLEYTLMRLTKGLSSGRAGVSVGFPTALSALLSHFLIVDPVTAIKYIKEYNPEKGPKEDVRNFYIGRCLGFASLLGSGRLNRGAEPEVWKEMTMCLTNHSASKDRATIALTCEVLSNLVTIAPEKIVKTMVPHIKEHISKFNDPTSPDILALAMQCRPHVSLQELMPSYKSDLFHRRNAQHLASALKNTQTQYPRTHLLWQLIQKEIQNRISKNDLQLQQFWSSVFNEDLFSSTEKLKHMSLNMLTSIIPSLVSEEIPWILDTNVVKTITTFFSAKGEIQKAARSAVDQLLLLAKQDIEKRMIIAFHLTKTPESENAKSKIISSLMAGITSEDLARYLTFLEEMFLKEARHRVWVAHQLLLTARRPEFPQEEQFIYRILKFLFFFGFFEDNAPLQKTEGKGKKGKSFQDEQIASWSFEGKITPIVRAQIRGYFVKLMIDVLKPHHEESPEIKDGQVYLKRICQLHVQLEDVGCQLAVSSKSDRKLRDQALRNSDEIYKSSPESPMAQSFDALNLQLGFQLEKLGAGVMPEEMMEELSTCFLKFHEKKKPKKEKGEPAPIIVLTDLLVALVSANNQILPVLVRRVFGATAELMNKEALEILIEALQTNVLDEAEEGEDEDDDMDLDQVENQVDQVEDEEDDEEDEDEDEDGTQTLKMIDMALSKVEEDDSEEEMTDEQMFKMDEAVAAVFKERRDALKNDRQAMLRQFQSQIYDMLNIVTRRSKSEDVVVALYKTLPSLIKLANKEPKAVVSITNILELKFPEKLSASLKEISENLWKTLPKVSGKVASVTRKAIAGCIKGLSTFEKVDQNEISAKFQELVSTFLKKRESCAPEFFQEFVSTNPWLGWKVLPILLEASLEGRNDFTKLSAFQFIAFLFHLEQLGDHKAEVEEAIPKLKESFSTLINQVKNNKVGILYKHLATILEDYNALFPKKIGSIWKVEEFRKTCEGKKGFSGYNRLLAALGGKPESAEKKKTPESKADKKGKEGAALKRKKERRYRDKKEI